MLTAGRRLKDKGIAIGKREIEEVPVLDSLPRHAGGADDPLMLVADAVDDAEVAE